MSGNIKELHESIQIDIENVFNGNFNDETLNIIKQKYLELIEQIKLIMISDRNVYYGNFMAALENKVTFTENIISGIELNSYPPVYVANPLVFCKYSLKNMFYVVAHEIEHIILNHPLEMIKANPTKDPSIFEKFNIAADASVNDRLNNETGFKRYMEMLEGGITSEVISQMINKPVLKEKSYKYYFDLLKKKKTPQKKSSMTTSSNDLGNENENTSSSSGNEENNNSNSESKKDYQDGKKNLFSNNKENELSGNSLSENNDNNNQSKNSLPFDPNSKLVDHDWKDDDISRVEAIHKQFIKDALNSMDNNKRGLVSSNYSEIIENINTPTYVPWQKILKQYAGTITSNKVKTRARLNRLQPERFDISGYKPNNILKLVIAIDTSGSIDSHALQIFFSEIKQLFRKRKYEITVIECDYDIKKIYKAKNASQLDYNVSGRGGTSFVPVIEYINSHKEYRGSLLIYFTDGYGDLEIPKPLVFKVLWLIYGQAEEISLKEPYGPVLRFKEN